MTAPQVFSSAWFVRHQRPLLALLNAPVVGGELRAALGMRRHDIAGDPRRRIVRLLPHACIVANPDGTYTIDVRTHAKYAKRLRYQFDLIWRAAHAWDRFVANPLVPALNVGFDTLTAFPDPNPETTTVDGDVNSSHSGDTWAGLRSGGGDGAADSATTINAFDIETGSPAGTYGVLKRGVYLFDTSPISSAGVISAAVLSLFGSTKVDGETKNPNCDIYTSAPASNTALASTDFPNFGTTSQTGGATAFSSLSTTAYQDFTLNATGRGNVNSSGVSKFASRNANFDAANVDPAMTGSFSSERWVVFAADQTGTSNDPKLVVTFALIVPGVYGQELSGNMVGQVWQ